MSQPVAGVRSRENTAPKNLALTQAMASQAVIDKLYNEIVETFDGVTADGLGKIALRLINLAQLQKGLTGPEKKDLVTHVVKKIVTDSGLLAEGELAAANIFIDVALPGMIDLLKDAFNAGAELAKSCGCSVM